MKSKQNAAVAALFALLAVTGYGIYWTGRPADLPSAAATREPGADSALAADQSSLVRVQQLVRLPTTADERRLAEDALRLADQEMDLAFASAVRRATLRPPAMTAEAKAIEFRVQQTARALAADQAQVTELADAVAKATGARRDSLAGRLDLAKAQAALDQDEADDAKQDLIRAGGDPQGRMQAIVAEHEASSRSSDSTRVVVSTAPAPTGLVRRLQHWDALREKESLLRDAKRAADSSAIVFTKRHDQLAARFGRRVSATDTLSRSQSAALLDSTQRRAANERARTALDQRVDNQHKLSDVYARWITVVRAHERTEVNHGLRGAAIILVIALFALLCDKWIEGLLRTITIDRRQTQTLCMVARVSLQVLAVLCVLLVVFGPPDNLGTFLGLAGAGLTVALKDFIIGFFGWFVLMGKNGIRIGDLVEINGVTGEVVELGMFHTVLIETGSWSDADHPTGRHVAFTNGFAIEGHYFNFSTSGQWLWDELRIVVPAGRDPHAIVEALRQQVESATADSARLAEQQWRGARRWPQVTALTAAPSVDIKPVVGGTEITIRFITRVADRSRLRADLYRTAVELLGTTREALPPSPTPVRMPASTVG